MSSPEAEDWTAPDADDVASRVLAVADFLSSTRDGQWAPLPAGIALRSLDEAYAVQVVLRERLGRVKGRVAGWSLAFVSPAMRGAFGAERPLVGAIHDERVFTGTASVRAQDFVGLHAGPTLAFRMAHNLPGEARPFDRETVRRAVGVCVPAIALIDDRGATRLGTVDGLQLVAENCWNAGLVLGAAIADWDRIDLSRLHARLAIQGRPIADGVARDSMGDPLDALTWLANELPRRGSHLKAGDWAALGPFLPMTPVAPGEQVVFTVDGTPPVSLGVLRADATGVPAGLPHRVAPPPFAYVSCEARVPPTHPLRAIRAVVDEALEVLSADFAQVWQRVGSPSIPPEKLVRLLLIQVLYTLRTERQVLEQLDYNLMFRWFVGLSMDAPIWDVGLFAGDRERLLSDTVGRTLISSILGQKRLLALLDDAQLAVDRAMIDAWAQRATTP